jgi:tRNA U54 and U55 pseudouridine synthase Pus10
MRSTDSIFDDVDAFAAWLQHLHDLRKATKGKARRKALTKAERREIKNKTGGQCHICGGEITGDDWEADHVLAHATRAARI